MPPACRRCPLAGVPQVLFVAVASNDRGQVVGTADTAAGLPHAVLWQDGSIVDLQDFLPTGGRAVSWAIDTNEVGQILVMGDGHTYLLTPAAPRAVAGAPPPIARVERAAVGDDGGTDGVAPSMARCRCTGCTTLGAQ